MKLIISPTRCVAIALTLLVALQIEAAQVLQRVSVRDSSLQPPAGGDGDSGTPILSPDGRFVLFSSSAVDVALIGSNSVPSQFPVPINVYLRDRIAGTNRLVSFNAAATAGGNGDSFPAALSANNQHVLFESDATNLVTGDTNYSDVFMRNLVTETTSLVSVDTNGTSANSHSYGAVMTPDARYVAFVSAATDLVTNDTNGIPDVFVRDLESGQTSLASVGATKSSWSVWDSMSDSPRITPDGRYVAFYSTATNMVPAATDKSGIYVRDMVSSETFWASTNARSFVETQLGVTNALNIVAFNHAISDDGQFVVFEAGSRSGYQGLILRFNRATGVTELVATNAAIAMAGGPFEDVSNLQMTPDGSFIAFVMTTNVPGGSARCIAVWDADTGLTTLASQHLNGAVQVHSVSDWPMLDPAGRYVAFVSNATNLTAHPFMGGFNLYVRDLEAEITTLVNVDSNEHASPISAVTSPSMAADGRQFAFAFPDGTLVPDDFNRSYDVGVGDLTAPAIELVSVREPSLAAVSSLGHAHLHDRSVSWDGRHVVFSSDGDDLSGTDVNGYRDVYVRDIFSGTSRLVSAATNGLAANAPSIPGGISADGRYVVFTSAANNLAPGDANGAQDVFVRDQLLETNILVSTSYLAPVSGNGPSSSPILSTNGQFVLFQSQANNLTQPHATGLFWRDLSLSTNRLVGGIGANALEGTMTPDGRLVAYRTSMNTVRVWDSGTGSNIYTSATSTTSPLAIGLDARWLVYLANRTLYGVDLEAGTNFTIFWQFETPISSQRVGAQFDTQGKYLTYSARSFPSGYQIYLFDFQAKTNKLISRAFNFGLEPNGHSASPAISFDGRYIAYVSSATNIVPGDHNGLTDVFLYDRLNGSNTLISVNLLRTGAANNRSFKTMFSEDGQTLIFQSAASDIIPGEFSHRNDIFALRLASAAITDTDNDQMDDDWELLHFETTARDGTEDFDHDGANDLFEFRTGTNPQNAASLFRGELMFSGDPAQMPLILWPAAPGKSYRVQFKDALDDSAWQELDGNVSIFGETGYATDPAPQTSHRFYRIILNEALVP